MFGIPFFFDGRTPRRCHVLDALMPRMRDALADNGLVLHRLGPWRLGRTSFPRDPVTRPRASLQPGEAVHGVRRRRDGAAGTSENGFNPVPLALTDVLMGLNTGLIDAYPSPPVRRPRLPVVPPDLRTCSTFRSGPVYRRHRHDRACVGSGSAKRTGHAIRESRGRRWPDFFFDRGAASGPAMRVAEMEKRGLTVHGGQRRRKRPPSVPCDRNG